MGSSSSVCNNTVSFATKTHSYFTQECLLGKVIAFTSIQRKFRKEDRGGGSQPTITSSSKMALLRNTPAVHWNLKCILELSQKGSRQVPKCTIRKMSCSVHTAIALQIHKTTKVVVGVLVQCASFQLELSSSSKAR